MSRKAENKRVNKPVETAKNIPLLSDLMALDRAEIKKLDRVLHGLQHQAHAHYWEYWARDSQRPPPGDWRIWLMMAGRGFGKTRSGAEWVRHIAETDGSARIALVGANLHEARSVMVEGESGLLNIGMPALRPVFKPSLRHLQWHTGAQAMLYSAAEPDSLRGPQHSHGWCDEIAKWDAAHACADKAWDNLMMGLRLGQHPQVVATTTPRKVPLVQRLVTGGAGTAGLVLTGGRMVDNRHNLAPHYVRAMLDSYGQTTLARQELDGELLAEVDGALWSRALLDRCRVTLPPLPQAGGVGGGPEFTRVVIGVDPPASANGDACGIIVAGLGSNGHGYVLADASVERPSPEAWARAVAVAAQMWNADRVVAEANQGGAMVKSVLHAADVNLPIKLVHASHGKVARAEPVAALYETGRVHHIGQLPHLEEQMCSLMTGGDYRGPGRSPDRLDAMVWALSELMLGRRGEPRVRVGW